MNHSTIREHGDPLERLTSAHIRYAQYVRKQIKQKRLTMWITKYLYLGVVRAWIGRIFNPYAVPVTVVRQVAKDEVMVVTRMKIKIVDNSNGTVTWQPNGKVETCVEIGKDIEALPDEEVGMCILGPPIIMAAHDVNVYVQAFEKVTGRRVMDTVIRDITKEYVK